MEREKKVADSDICLLGARLNLKIKKRIRQIYNLFRKRDTFVARQITIDI